VQQYLDIYPVDMVNIDLYQVDYHKYLVNILYMRIELIDLDNNPKDKIDIVVYQFD
jgi:hypothetical protein